VAPTTSSPSPRLSLPTTRTNTMITIYGCSTRCHRRENPGIRGSRIRCRYSGVLGQIV
jgi:hypothetical protein